MSQPDRTEHPLGGTSVAPGPVVHRPAPYVLVRACMVFVALIGLPGYVIDPVHMLAGPGVLGLALVGGFELVLGAIAFRRVELSFDRATRGLDVLELRWPFRERRWQVPVDDVVDVARRRMTRGRSVRLVLVLGSGEEKPLTQSFFGDGAHMTRDLAAIGALVASAQAQS